MAIEDNKDVVRRLVEECVNAHRAELLSDFVGHDVHVHPGTPGAAPDTVGLDALREAFHGFRASFPDLRIRLDHLLAEDDLVAARWTATGTHTGALAGIEPTGAHVRWGGTDIYRLSGGKVVEWWRNDDFVWLLHQVGRDVASAVP
ncbi:putative ester cyclase [Blastococcus colisei]|uniref:Putative ester cyclase n=1 Tax=Blastococcus colisei TaxID=1564162 RepID=A0A543PHM9_9ACTN|nr:ester cyclase [Blastococcus colisei]TQN43575.1 putative ester cyclase [Blastococcus colisei]